VRDDGHGAGWFPLKWLQDLLIAMQLRSARPQQGGRCRGINLLHVLKRFASMMVFRLRRLPARSGTGIPNRLLDAVIGGARSGWVPEQARPELGLNLPPQGLVARVER
jgi:hypothetical protein